MKFSDKCRITEDLKIRRKLLNMGFGITNVGPTGPSAITSTDGFFSQVLKTEVLQLIYF